MRIAALVLMLACFATCKRSEPALVSDGGAGASTDALDGPGARACGTPGGPCCAGKEGTAPTCGGIPLLCAGATCTCIVQATAIYDFTPVVRHLDGRVLVARDRVHFTEIMGPAGNLSAIDLAVSGSTAYGTAVGCAVDISGGVACFPLGENVLDSTPIGNGAGPGATTTGVAAVVLDSGEPLADVRQISGTMNGGATAFCATTIEGGILCWGNGSPGFLGRGDKADAPVARPVLESPGVEFTQASEVQLGYDSACARKIDGTVWCWGNDASGQTGNAAPDANDPTILFPVGPLPLPARATRLATSPGNTHCAILEDGHIWCWGANAYAQAGAPPSPSAPPTLVLTAEGRAPLAQVVEAAPDRGMQAMCANTSAGVLFCWGHPFAPAGTVDATSPYPISIPIRGALRAPVLGRLSSYGGRDGTLVYIAPDGNLTFGAGSPPFAAQPSCD